MKLELECFLWNVMSQFVCKSVEINWQSRVEVKPLQLFDFFSTIEYSFQWKSKWGLLNSSIGSLNRNKNGQLTTAHCDFLHICANLIRLITLITVYTCSVAKYAETSIPQATHCFPLPPGHACPMLRHGSRLQLKAFEGYSTTFTGICLKQARIVAA